MNSFGPSGARTEKSSGHHPDTKIDHEAARKTHELLAKHQQQGLSKSDDVFHKIAGGTNKKTKATKATAKTTAAKKTIPLDADKSDSEDELKEFNN